MTTMTAQALAEGCAKAMWDEDKASAGLGMAIAAVSPGHSEITMSITEAMVNGHGTCHGGYIFTLADSAFAFACNSHNQRSVAQHCAVTYVAPARLGDVLIAEAVERHRAERSGITDVRVTTSQGTLIAEFRGHSRTVPGTLI